MKIQKLNEPGVSLADFASEIAENESLNTSEAEQIQEETVDFQPDEQVTHDCSTQTEAFDHLYRSVASLSVKDCPRTDVSTQTEEFDYLFTHSSKSKPFNQNYFRDDNAKVSFYTGLPTYKVLEATFIHVSPFVKRRTQCLTLFQEMIMVFFKYLLNIFNTFYLFSAPYFITHVATFLYCFYVNILEFLVSISLVISQLYISTC